MVQQYRTRLPVQETQEMWVPSLGREDPLQKEMATHSNILTWGNPVNRRAGPGYSSWGHKESDTT